MELKMQIRELRLNILFEYIKEIRRYTYDIQDFLQKNNLCDNVNIVPPIPDDIEPQIERLSTTKINEDKTINILVSQVSISILFVYNTSLDIKDHFEKEAKYMSNISKGIKELLSFKKNDFKINFEGLIIASSETVNKENDSLISKMRLKENIEENREKVIKELDLKHFESIEKSTVKFYNDLVPDINVMSVKNKRDDFIGWNYILVVEINNRLEYHNSKNENTNSIELDFDFAIEEIKKIFKKEEVI